jgi:glycosyltransferase involved in cell wall biosynthesis
MKPIINEIVIVDTGSSDRTKDLALAYGAQVYDFEWIDDFAAARNFSISKAKGDWILVLDADEVISSKDFRKLSKLLSNKSQKTSAYSLTTRNYCNKPNTVTWEPNDGFYPEEEKGFGWLPSEKVRIFRNKDSVKFEGAVHEMVDPYLKRNNMSIKKCSIPIHHYGTLNVDELDRKGRLYYNIGLKKLQENGNDINALREVAVQATELCENDDALRLWEDYLALQTDSRSTSEAFVNMGAIYMRMHDYDRALYAANNAVSSDPGLKEGHYNLAIATLFQGQPEKSIETLENLIKWCSDYPPAYFFLAVSKCCAGFKAEGVIEFEKLKNTPLGPALSTTCVELCEKLLKAGQIQFVLNILQSAMEAKIISQGIMDLYSRCMEQFDKIPYSNAELQNEWESIEHQGVSV